ncbi:MAG: DMT family transporter [Ruminococcaceae bacterium]|nr:DMT family transporter [Oscillospiraceae bacterium]
MNGKSLRGSLMLLIGAAIWGSAFVAQDVGMNYVGPYTFNALRYFVGALTLLPIIFISDRIAARRHPERDAAEIKKTNRRSWFAGMIAGLALIIPTTMQQIGIIYTTAGKAGMITGMYIITVPLLGIFLGKKCGLNVWAAVVMGVVGMYLLCVTEKLTISGGDIILLISIVFWAVQILVIDHFASSVDCFRLVCMEFVVCAVISAVPAAIGMVSGAAAPLLNEPALDRAAFEGVLLPVLYVGIFSCGIAYTLQPLGQRDTPPAAASLIMCLESVFAALTGYLLLGDGFTGRELIGCALMLGASVLAQFPFSSGKTDGIDSAVSR